MPFAVFPLLAAFGVGIGGGFWLSDGVNDAKWLLILGAIMFVVLKVMV
ncbi:hypothetical protein [Vibrio sp. qd031]|nr:hypothetical protein [Vibrio sp. qd031]